MIPTFIFQVWLLGLLSVGLIGGVIYLGHEWQQQSWAWDPIRMKSIFAPRFGANEKTAMLVGAVLLLLIVLAGGSIVKAILPLTHRSKPNDDPRIPIKPASVQRLHRPDGSELEVQFYGAPEGMPMVSTHGWGLHGAEWNYLKRELADRFRLVIWDEPGLGKSRARATATTASKIWRAIWTRCLRSRGTNPQSCLGTALEG